MRVKLANAKSVFRNEGLVALFIKTYRHLLKQIRCKKQAVSEGLFLSNKIDKGIVYKRSDDVADNAAFTIVSKNYMHYALTLRESFLLHNDGYRFVIILMDMFDSQDELNTFLELIDQGVEVVNFNSLRLSINAGMQLDEMLAKYSILEINTAIKPFVIESLLKDGHEMVLYIDPDIYFYDKIDVVENGLKNNNFVLTPHITTPYADDKSPTEIDIMRGGTYNLGFIGIKNTGESFKMVKWWQERLLHYCYSDPDRGLFTDQKWMDLMPSLYDGVRVEKHPGLNVAYWNLHERRIDREESKWKINGESLVFFHFSGLPLSGAGTLSKHQNRFQIDSVDHLGVLVEQYRKSVNDFAPKMFGQFKYHYSSLSGIRNLSIPDAFRKQLFEESYPAIRNPYLGCKFVKDRLVNYLNEDMFGDGLVSRLSLGIWNQREDLKTAFANVAEVSESREAYNNWFKCAAEREYKVPVSLLGVDCYVNSDEEVGFGLNVIGYFENVIGVAEAARLLYQKGLAFGVPMSLFSILSEAHGRLTDKEMELYRSSLSEWPIYKKSLFYVNANEIANVKKYFPHLFEGKHISAVWWWEFDDYFSFPEGFECVDRVITYTGFVETAIKKSAPQDVEVLKLTYPFVKNWEITADKCEVRDRLGIGQNETVFIYVFDLHSGFERKNPIALIEAFGKYKEKYENGRLLLKIGHPESHEENYRLIVEAIRKHGLSNHVIIVDKPLSRNDLMTLISAADAYVSPHRSEGLGLGMLEAMWMGLPVIATRYGGNLEFMTESNSILIDYDLVGIKEDFGPYKKGWLWAEPSVDHLASAMGMLVVNPEEVEWLAKSGQQSVWDQFAPKKFYKELGGLLA